ncbi:hypothetical protein Sjap_005344 [Stephania japonica]|uniref:Uncharacterized protein n=1 Tax=Stephania japonica TaxID=461633 RepID=A0AAP0K3S8_9MAGN
MTCLHMWMRAQTFMDPAARPGRTQSRQSGLSCDTTWVTPIMGVCGSTDPKVHPKVYVALSLQSCKVNVSRGAGVLQYMEQAVFWLQQGWTIHMLCCQNKGAQRKRSLIDLMVNLYRLIQTNLGRLRAS